MEFRVLGPLEVVGDDGPVVLRGLKRRGLLAFLLVHRGRMVPAERIAEEVWEAAADRGVATVQTYVSQLRKLLADAETTSIVTHPAGYVLELAPDALDAARFERGVRAAGDEVDPNRAVALFDAALSLWRGPALDEFSWPWAVVERARLERVRTDAVQRRVEIRLGLGHHHDLLPELESLTSEYPLDEQFWRQRMLASYRSGNQVDALRAFQLARSKLAEAGVEPGPALVELERRILEQDPGLDTHAPSRGVVLTTAPSHLPSGVVTFLLTDVVGSTELWEAWPDEMQAALARHDDVVAQVVARHGGHLLKFRGEGDSTFSVFARATDGFTAAVELQRELAVQAWPEPAALVVRAAVATGEAVERDGDYFGTQVNRAARLRGLARGGEVLLSNSTAEVVRHHLPSGVRLDDLGARALKGSQYPERVHRVRFGDDDSASRPARALPRRPGLPQFLTRADGFVGRVHELERLQTSWDRVRDGWRQVAFVVGEPGIGKSTLVAEFARTAHDDGAIVLAGRCDEGYDVPYQPFLEALAHVADEPRAAVALDALDPTLRDEIGRIVPDVDRRTASPPVAQTDPETARYRLFEAVAAFLAALSDEAPVVLLAEDLHWASAPTVLMLRHLVRHPAPGLFIVATYRQTEVVVLAQFADLLADVRGHDDFELVELEGLSEADVATMSSTVATCSAVDVPDPSWIVAQTGGNALFVRELLRSLTEPSADGQAAPALSAPLRDVIRARVRRLTRRSQQLLDLVAVLGTEFTLSALLAIDETSLDQDELLDALDEASASGLISDASAAPGTYRFTHAVVRNAIHDGLPSNQRRRLHLGIARALERTTASAHVSQLSQHFFAALPLGGGAAAVEYSREAGDHAMALLAFEEAVEHYERALEARRFVERDATADDCDITLALAGAHMSAGDVRSAAAVSTRAAELARQLGLPHQLARAALCFEGEILPGGEFWQQRLLLLEEAAEQPMHDDGPLRVRVLAMLARVRRATFPGSEIEELTQEAVDLASQLGDDLALAAAFSARRDAVPDAPERAALSRQVIEHAQAAGATDLTMLGRHMHLSDVLDRGEIDEFDADFATYLAAAHEIRRPHDLWRAEVVRAMRALFDGRLEEGEALSRDAFDVGTRLQQPGALQSYVVQSFFVAWQRSALAPLLPTVRAWVDMPQSVPTWRAGLAVALCQAGDVANARAELHRLALDDFAGVDHDNLWLATLSIAAEACSLVGDGDVANTLATLIAPHDRRNVTVGTALALGSAARPLGLLAMARGDFDAAVAWFDQAVADNARMRSSLFTALARRGLIAALRARRGPHDEARASAEEHTLRGR